MNSLEIVCKMIGNLTDEQKAELTSILTPEANDDVETTVDTYVDEDFGEVPKRTIAEVKSMKIAPSPSQARYGYDKQMGRDGKEFAYKRTAFDGPVTELDERHKMMKPYFIMFSKYLIQEVNDFCGAGEVAITMYEPQNKASNKDGKVFYRWNGQHTSALMDRLWSIIEPFAKLATGEE